MPISAPTPTTLPATQEKVYDKYWLQDMHIMAPDCNGAVKVRIVLRKARIASVDPQTGGNIWEYSPTDAPVLFEIANLFALAATRQNLGPVMESLLAEIQAIGQAQNIL